jgi:hypothetical protein
MDILLNFNNQKFLKNNSNTMLKKTLIAASLFQAASFSQQFGGMWIPTEINEKEMKSLG